MVKNHSKYLVQFVVQWVKRAVAFELNLKCCKLFQLSCKQNKNNKTSAHRLCICFNLLNRLLNNSVKFLFWLFARVLLEDYWVRSGAVRDTHRAQIKISIPKLQKKRVLLLFADGWLKIVPITTQSWLKIPDGCVQRQLQVFLRTLIEAL